MIKIFDGKIYDSSDAKCLVDTSTYHNGNYAGSDKLMQLPSGELFIYEDSNGQDCYRDDAMYKVDNDGAMSWLDARTVSDDEVQILISAGLVQVG